MAITINGNGTITGISVGGLPDGIVDTDMIATNAVTAAKASGSVQGITEVDSWRITSSQTAAGGTGFFTSNWERDDTSFEKIGTGVTESSGVFTFPSTGKYLLTPFAYFYHSRESDYVGYQLHLSTDGGSNFNIRLELYDSAHGESAYGAVTGQEIIDVTNTSNFQFKFGWNVQYDNATFRGDSNKSRTGFTVIKLGDT